MHKVEWTQEAEDDLYGVLAYYFEVAGDAITASIFRRIHDQVGSLAMFPERCRLGRVTGTHEYVISRLPFIAVVKIEIDVVFVLNLVHTARKFP